MTLSSAKRLAFAVLVISLIFSCMLSAVPAQAQTLIEVLNNRSVLEMVDGQLPEDVIIAKIQSAETKFDLSTPALVELHKRKVSSNIVKAMMSPRAALVVAQDAPIRIEDQNDPLATHEAGIYLYTESTSGKKLIMLEPTVYSQGKSGGVFASAMTYGIAKVKWKAVVRNNKANARVSDAKSVFYFYFEETNAGLSRRSFGGTSTPNEFTLLRFDVKGDSRETVVMKASAFGSSTGTDEKANIPFTHKKIRPGVYKLTPTAPLIPGEYGFISSASTGAFAPGAASANRVFDFGINLAE